MSLILSWHPTYAFFRAPSEYGAFSIDLDRFARLIAGKVRADPKSRNLNPTSEDILALARKAEFLSYDIETLPAKDGEQHTGKDPLRARLRMIGFGTPEEAVSYYWFKNVPSIERAIKKVLESPKIPKVALNELWFDDVVLQRYGIQPRNVIGLREMRRAISSTSKLSLAHITSLYTDAHPWKEDEEEDDKGLVFTDDIHKLGDYHSYDLIYTARDFEEMRKEEDWNTPRVQRIYEVHRELARIASEMYGAGIHVVEENRRFMEMCLLQERREKTSRLRKFLKLPKDWKPNANAMRCLIYKRYKRDDMPCFELDDPQDPKMWTDDGMIKVDRNALIKVCIDPLTPPELKQAIDMFWEADQPMRWINTFLSGEKVKQAIGPDGRLRPGWNSCGTDTMRWSCSAPNVMNLPQILRAMYGPAPGKVLVHADKSQLELRVMAWRANDAVLQRNLDTGDVYSEDARAWFRLPADADIKKAHPKERKASKIVHLAKNYGASDKTVFASCLKQDRGFKMSAVRYLSKAFEELYRDGTVRYWHEEYKETVKRGYSEGAVLGVRRYYPTVPELSAVVNYPIQTSAGEMMNLELIALDKSLKKHVPSARILIQLHDAVDVECYPRDAKTVTRIIEEVMSSKEYDYHGRKATFPVEIKIATKDWSEV